MSGLLFRLAALLTLPVMLASCSSIFGKKEPPPCPPVYFLGDAAKITRYMDGPGRDLTDVLFEAELHGYKGECSYDEKGGVISLQVIFAVTRGPANSARKADFTYFAAIPYFYPDSSAKAEFPVSVTFPEGVNQVRHTDEEIILRIPVKDREVINKYEVYLGFQTSEAELNRNRALRRN